MHLSEVICYEVTDEGQLSDYYSQQGRRRFDQLCRNGI